MKSKVQGRGDDRAMDPMPGLPHDAEEFDQSLQPAVPIGIAEALLLRSRRAAGIASGFLLGQGTAQAINVLAGLFLVRALSVEAYAQFGIATGFQSVFSVLMDLGFASTIIPLVGDRQQDRRIVGKYVRAARRLRDRTFWILAPVASLAFLATIHKQHWNLHVQILLLVSILISLYSGGVMSFFSAPLLLRGKLQEFYVPQVISGMARMIAYFFLSLVRGLNAWTAAALGALNVTLNGILIRKAGRKYLDWPAKDDHEADREMLRYVIPATPAIVFSAFQSQISLFLISILGGSTLYVAQVAALGRIGQIFLVLTTFNTVVVEPYMARCSRDAVLRNYLGMVLLISLACVPVVFVAFRLPMVFLWVLGAKFEGLRPEIGWYVLSACLNFISGLVWIMNRARKWVFWSGSILEICLLLTAQTVFVALVGIRDTHHAVMFALASSGCYMVAHGYVSLRGFLQQDPASAL